MYIGELVDTRRHRQTRTKKGVEKIDGHQGSASRRRESADNLLGLDYIPRFAIGRAYSESMRNHDEQFALQLTSKIAEYVDELPSASNRLPSPA
jgi:hypothetical protein